ncbi:aminotransferase class I/II-fold pyridoxal phosphate-dependent enzyme [Limnobacter humi]|uniref:Aminotransferase class I/II-fold pyridoxal phosphate-dependent enzyme n=1 Tax=Limnobacter humi TaxID=1778671 RepID=A0ABT1WFK7_9BURK|nr:aminotransferase class I/II-fold pyridoxal phosphate-dependent enzyme [Limnobacter humi]MCQ8896255.1 aminotransferase class I/II-fold pyridoxal phosphate-dependent enzyme [Limnobacter humi]
MFIDTRIAAAAKLDLSGSVAPDELPLPPMPADIWAKADVLRSHFHARARQFFDCESVLAVTGIESGISGLARLFQTWYGSMRIVLAEPSFDQWDKRFRRASHIVLDWPVDMILEGDIPECDVLILARPVNPTCELISIERVKALAHQLRQQGGWLILDEAYLDWTDEPSYAAWIDDCPAIVLRSVAPFSGLQGANLAFVCAPKAVCSALLNEVGTQAVSAPQWWLALQFFEAAGWRVEQRARLREAVGRLERLWSTTLGVEDDLYKGGYFVAFRHVDTETWAHQLERLGILVRTYPTEQGVLIRCGVPKTEADWLRLELALRSLRKQLKVKGGG